MPGLALPARPKVYSLTEAGVREDAGSDLQMGGCILADGVRAVLIFLTSCSLEQLVLVEPKAF